MGNKTRTHQDPVLIKTVHDLAIEGYSGVTEKSFASKVKYEWIRRAGSRLWLDTGDKAAAEKVWAKETEALTTNNTLVNKVVQTGSMDEFIPYAASMIRQVLPEISAAELVMEIGFLVNARLALDLVQRFGAHVSVELHPDLANDLDRTLVYARRYFDICREFFYIKVPLTPDGLVAVRRLSNENIPVNLTLGFSARQNYLTTLFARPRFVNVFLGRLNSLVEENKLGSPENIGEKAALSSNETVKILREKNGINTSQIAASIRSGKQIAALAGIDVLTMPTGAAQEYLDLEINESDIHLHNSKNLDVNLDNGNSRSVEVADLWDIDEAFTAFTDDLMSRADEITSGRDLIELSNRNNVNIFHDWTEEERLKIRVKGKIPDLSNWPGIAIDDLLSISALESFAGDQADLDRHIETLVNES